MIKETIDFCAYQKGILMHNNYLEITVNCDLYINTKQIERFQSLFRAYKDGRIVNKNDYINFLAEASVDTLKEIDIQIFKSIVDGIKERGMFNSANEKVIYKVYVDISDRKQEFIEIMRIIKSFLSTNSLYFELYKSDIKHNNNNQPILFKSKWNDTNTVQRIIILDSELAEFSDYIFL